MVFGALIAVQAQASHSLLEITASSARRGASGSFLIVLKPAAVAAGLVALQLELSVGTGITIETGDIMAGSAAESAQKKITCAARQAQFMCILAGDKKTLPAGTIMVVRYKASPRAHPGAVEVRITNATGTSADSKPLDVGNAKAAITIE